MVAGNRMCQDNLHGALSFLGSQWDGMVWQVNHDLVIVDVQGDTQSVLKVPVARLINQSVSQLLAECSQYPILSAVLTSVLKVHASKTSLNFSMPLKGITFPDMQWAILPVLNEGKVESIYVLGINICSRKQQEDAALKLRFLENIIDHVPHFLFWKDKDSTFLGANNRFVKTANLSSTADIVGKTDYDLPWKKEESDAYVADDREVMRTGIAKINIEETQTINGEEITLLTSKVPIYEHDGSVLGVLGIYSNITERKRVEKELRVAIEKAEVANQAKTTFLAKVSHELRTPLNGILGTTQILNNKDYDPELKTHIRDIEFATTHLLNLVNDILDFSCFEEGQIVVRFEPVNINELIKKVVTGTSHRVANPDVEVVAMLDENVPSLVIGDEFRIKQIMINLVNNAIKFTEKGRIMVSAKCLKQTALKAKIRLSVQDTGMGIPEEMQKKIFERFFQVDAGYSRAHEGVGLGLAISQQIAMAMGSKIFVESVLNRGSLFWMDLDFDILNLDKNSAYRQFYESGLEAGNNAYDETYQAKVLVVEDNKLNQKIIGNMLTELGCTVDLALDGKTALELADKNDYDVIFMDIGLPYMDGIEVTEALRKMARHEATPIIATTAHAFEADIQRCRDATMNDVLTKPLTVSGLKNILSVWASNKRN